MRKPVLIIEIGVRELLAGARQSPYARHDFINSAVLISSPGAAALSLKKHPHTFGDHFGHRQAGKGGSIANLADRRLVTNLDRFYHDGERFIMISASHQHLETSGPY